MFGPKFDILVSISIGYEQAQDDGEKHYIRPHHTWMISVQPHKQLLSGKKTVEASHYTLSRDLQNGQYTVQQTNGGGHGILGNILIASSIHTTPDEVLRTLQSTADAEAELPSAIPNAEDSEAWIRRALHALQHDKVVETFDVGEFMTFAHSYVNTRTDGNASTVAPYPGARAEKPKGNGFRISYANNNPNRSGDRTYGGLM